MTMDYPERPERDDPADFFDPPWADDDEMDDQRHRAEERGEYDDVIYGEEYPRCE